MSRPSEELDSVRSSEKPHQDTIPKLTISMAAFSAIRPQLIKIYGNGNTPPFDAMFEAKIRRHTLW